MHHPDLCIAGAGIIGLSLALELHDRGYRVTVFDQGAPLAESSTAAAGMLAAHDPDNPPQLLSLASLSLSLYPDFLDRIHTLSGLRIPFQTHTTLQSVPPDTAIADSELTCEDLAHLLPALTPSDHRFVLLDEHSLDPRQLASALLAAVRATTINLQPHTAVLSTHSIDNAVEITTPKGTIHAAQFVNCTGAWAAATSRLPNIPVAPRKGQMFSVSLPPSLPLHFVLRTPDIYIVPRTAGPATGRAIIGATVEDIGFDKAVHPADIDRLRSLAAALLPAIARAHQLEAWSGLRPATSDGLPLLGVLPGQPNHFIATGHYRNGILLAPATARVMAEFIVGGIPSVDLSPFSPARSLSLLPSP
ncbi:NAD(P)/FAD-dependent oxidoreductase [Tunturibacter empetritectus]|uniref:Glycine oxidase n=1 Tax=Tunturiibacter empetritectus TaxID=3069691 RepID=A0A7W8IIW4_9BACT|nr:FAD-dependent oxidoreductase [Edaphobacter lichenicola]MBB5318001.1 glycine oxidase [Edaphobacter lichenicola]